MLTVCLVLFFQSLNASADSSVLAPAKATMDFKAAPAPNRARRPARRGLASVEEVELAAEIADTDTEAGFELFCQTCSPQKSKSINEQARDIAREAQKEGG